MALTIKSNVTSGVFVPEIWGAKVLTQRENYLVAAKCVERYDEEVASYGDTIKRWCINFL